MIRKAIIVVLTLAAVGTGVAWAATLVRPVFYSVLTAQGAYLEITVSDGTADFVALWENGHPSFGTFLADIERSRLDRNGTRRRAFTLMEQGFPLGIGGTGERVPLCLPFILFAAYPTIAFIRGPLRR